jgi:hypothetical protein
MIYMKNDHNICLSNILYLLKKIFINFAVSRLIYCIIFLSILDRDLLLINWIKEGQ